MHPFTSFRHITKNSLTSAQTTSFFLSFFLFLTLHPEAQAKAQAEIDAVLGKEQRLPILADRPDLPYVEALIKEVFRCGIVGALALPHVLREDDTYNGYFIPKGTFVIPNIWYVLWKLLCPTDLFIQP
jgi:cytochrome P450